MPLETAEDFALGDTSSTYCKYCTDESGKLLPYETILQSNARHYQESQGLTAVAATKMAKDLMKTMPAWKNVP